MLGFIGLALPGLIYEALSERHRPVLQLSPLREAGRVAVVSLVCVALAAIAAGLVRSVWPAAMPDPTPLIGDTRRYLSHEYRLVARAVLFVVVFSCAFAAAGYLAIVKRRADVGHALPHDTQWATFHADVHKGAVPFVEFRLPDGSTIRGRLLAQDTVRPRSDRFIAVRRPFRVQDADGVEIDCYEWQRVLVPLDIVQAVFVHFAPPSET